MSETTHDPTGQEIPAEQRQQPRLVTNYPTPPEVLVFTAPYNVAVSFSQLLAMNGLTPAVIAGIQPASPGGGETGATGAMGPAERKK